ncbi:MAG: ATP-binding cassette domain-containing protein, partial [Planctomycetota bacterium]
MSLCTARLRGVSKSFGKGPTLVRALVDVDLDIYPGELTLIEGPSGSGKTTLLHILSLLQRPETGEVWLDRHRTDLLPESRLPDERRGRIALIFQGYNLLEALTVHDNVAVAGLLSGGWLPATAVEPHLRRFGMSGRGTSLPAELSGGEKQRTSIARALACGGRLILADEPTANLDWENAQEVMKHLAALAHQEGKAVVMVSHDSRLEPFADRIVGLLNGRISSDRRTREKLPSRDREPNRDRQGAAPRDCGLGERHPTPSCDGEAAGNSMGVDTGIAIPRTGRHARLARVGALLGMFAVLMLAGMVVVRYLVTAAPTGVDTATTEPTTSVTPYVAAAPAVVEPDTQLVAVRTERQGRIKAVLKHAGERVVRGEPLVLLDDVTAKALVDQRRADLMLAEANLARLRAWDRPEERAKARAGVERAQAKLDRAEQELARIQSLYERTAAPETELHDAVQEKRSAAATLIEAQQVSAISETGPIPEEVRVAEAKVEQARAALHLAETELALLTIVSPLDGHVVYRHLEPGEVVDPEAPVPILSVGNLDEVRLRAEVDEADITRVRPGQEVVATAEAFDDRKFTGRVVHLEPLMGRKSIRTERTTEQQDTKVREVL